MSINIFIGPMFSGKTNRLIIELNKSIYSNKKTILIKFITDNRYTNETNTLISNDNIQYSYENAIKTKYLKSRLSILETMDYIFIDEGQFFEDLIETCVYLKKKNKIIFISYLNLGFNLNLFNNIGILAHSDTISTLTSVCYKCKCTNANYTHLKEDYILNHSANRPLIGGSEKYQPICIKCIQNLEDKIQFNYV